MSLNTTKRIEKLRQALEVKEIDGIFISQPQNRYYLSGFNGSAGYLLITGENTIIATDFRYIEQVKVQAPDYQIFQITGNISDWFPRLSAGLDLKRLGFEAEDITFAMYRQLTEALSKGKASLQLVPVDGLVTSLRAVKEPEEIELIEKAVEITDMAYDYIERIIHAGITEKEVAWELEKFQREQGSQTLPFDIILASGSNSALPHAKPTERKINNGEPLVIDMGAKFEGYCSDLTRTICIGEPDKTFKKIYDTVLGAQLTAITLIKEGMNGQEADGFARTVIAEAGYADYFGHSLGHGVGLAEHEQPRLGPNSNELLTSGMVFSVEPGIYLPGWGGVRIEDLVMIENGQIRVLSQSRK